MASAFRCGSTCTPAEKLPAIPLATSMVDKSVVCETAAFDTWLQETLRKERAALMTQIKQQITKHLDDHHSALLQQVASQLIERDEPAVTLPLVQAPTPATLQPTPPEPEAFAKTIVGVDVDGGPDEMPACTHPPDNSASRSGQASHVSGGKGKEASSVVRNTKFKRLAEGSGAVDPDANCLTRVVASPIFEVVSLAAILTNAALLAVQIHYDGFDHAYHMNHPYSTLPAHRRWPNADKVFDIAALFFVCIFVVELLLRVLVMRFKSLRSRWIWLDFVLVLFGVLDIMDVSVMDLNPTMLRLARMVRVVRVIKFARHMESCHSLFLLLKSVAASVHALVWSFVMLFFMMMSAAMFTNQMLAKYFKDDSKVEKDRHEIFELFGNFPNAMFTMFEITLANWVLPVRTLMSYVSGWYGVFFVMYRCFFCFAVVNVIRAVFITETSRVAHSDDEVALMAKTRASAAIVRKLQNVFNELDADNDGRIDWTEFQELLKNSFLREYMKTLELDVHDMVTLFNVLDDGDGGIDNLEFIQGISALRGSAKSLDILALQRISRRIEHKVDVFSGNVPSTKRLSFLPPPECGPQGFSFNSS